MPSAKQEMYWYHVLRLSYDAAGVWTRDLPHSKQLLYHKAIEAVNLTFGKGSIE